MLQTRFDTPILFIIFNRPNVTQKVFDRIRSIKPRQLFIVADGPRTDKPNDTLLCKQTRNITEEIDWDCDVKRLYSEKNKGCDKNIIEGISWFFENVEQGIILEDDCVPNESFFSFCDTLLQKYKNVQEIMHINGSNFQFGKIHGDGSYYFSKYPHSWGWATWRRAWKFYDHKLKTLPAFVQDKKIDILTTNRREKKFWLNFFKKLRLDKYPFWDSRWTYSIWSQNGKVITPNVNLISNIGFGTTATHTNKKENLHERDIDEMFEIIDPSSKTPVEDADRRTFETYYHRSPLQKAVHVLLKIINK